MKKYKVIGGWVVGTDNTVHGRGAIIFGHQVNNLEWKIENGFLQEIKEPVEKPKEETPSKEDKPKKPGK
jgi:hypothetical protein